MIYHAPFVIPVAGEPIADGAVLITGSKIADIGPFSLLKSRYSSEQTERLSNQLLLPGFVNPHAHLELSSLAGKLQPGTPFVPWIRQIIGFRMGWNGKQKLDSIGEGIQHLIRHGITTVGDISSDGASASLIQRAGIGGVVFREVLGFNSIVVPRLIGELQYWWQIRNNDAIYPGISPHAPYSTNPDIYKYASALAGKHHWPLATHLAETEEEVTFLKSAGGAFRELLEERGAWDLAWQPPGCSPVKYLAHLGVLEVNTLAVHLNHLEPGDIELLAASRVHVVTCSGSNRWFGRKNPWIKWMLDSGLNICLGTDSLASNYGLDMLREMQYLHQDYPEIPPEQILGMATLNGAKALGLDWQTGSLEPGKQANLISLSIPSSIPISRIYDYIVGQSPKICMVIAKGKIIHSPENAGILE